MPARCCRVQGREVAPVLVSARLQQEADDPELCQLESSFTLGLKMAQKPYV